MAGLEVVTDFDCPLLQEGPPAWASGFGQDQYGYFVELTLPRQDVATGFGVQRLRWIPAGEFWMGSAAGEPGRYDDEVRHRVRVTCGYWLFDSACPQWLWQSVMGENPSRFVDPDRPVERVSWDLCQEFMSRLNKFFGVGGSFRLPRECEWEYACRAGSETALYTGDLTLLGERHGPELDGIAWYGGNSGVGYDHSESEDGSSWPEKQYEFGDCGSRRVKEKRCNSWGLYDMLGNVWEWCSDWYGAYDLGIVTDPLGVRSGSDRVLRGGSWYSDARYVRAAYRLSYDPGIAGDVLGFRPLSAASGTAEQASGSGVTEGNGVTRSRRTRRAP
ncbi:MAG: formylglycine-generating enzyme family protein [Planctomycetaceae bacterium]